MVFHALLAQTYGAGVYGSGTYGGATVQIGPVILPATGAGILAVISILIIAAGIGLFVWTRQRRKQAAK